jgi:hypothetical protein
MNKKHRYYNLNKNINYNGNLLIYFVGLICIFLLLQLDILRKVVTEIYEILDEIINDNDLKKCIIALFDLNTLFSYP